MTRHSSRRYRGPDDVEQVALGPCCVCGGAEDVHTVVMLPRRAPTPGRGWGCLVCGLPGDGAVAVLCDRCMRDAGIDGDPVTGRLRWACDGYPGEGKRVPVELLTEAFEHDMTRHPGEF